jgi:hypothetical protein
MRILLLFWLLGLGSAFAVSTLTITDNRGSSPISDWGDSYLHVTPSVSAIPVTTGGTATYSTVNGIYQSSVTTASKYNQQLSFTGTGSRAVGLYPTWTSSNPTNAPISTGGFVTHNTDGSYVFTGSFPPYLNLAIPITLTTTTVVANVNYINWTAGLLPADMNNEVNTLITAAGTANAGTTQAAENSGSDITKLGGNMSIFSAVNDNTLAYTRNTGAWIGTLDLSGISCWGISLANTFANVMTLVTPTDAICANHCVGGGWINTFSAYVWVNNLNVAYTAKVTNLVQISGDLELVHLAWEGTAPPTTGSGKLAIYPVLPSNYQHYAPTNAGNYNNLSFFPVIMTNQFRQVFVQDASLTLAFNGGLFIHYPATESSRSPYTVALIGGDSSSPIFADVNGVLILLGTNTTSSICPSVADNITTINTAISSFSGDTYSLTVVPVTGFIATTNNGNVTSFPSY